MRSHAAGKNPERSISSQIGGIAKPTRVVVRYFLYDDVVARSHQRKTPGGCPRRGPPQSRVTGASRPVRAFQKS
jgi:hypothetical protein